ncbi:hypothetical protein QTP88_024192 [Uroleucon formosanum]
MHTKLRAYGITDLQLYRRTLGVTKRLNVNNFLQTLLETSKYNLNTAYYVRKPFCHIFRIHTNIKKSGFIYDIQCQNSFGSQLAYDFHEFLHQLLTNITSIFWLNLGNHDLISNYLNITDIMNSFYYIHGGQIEILVTDVATHVQSIQRFGKYTAVNTVIDGRVCVLARRIIISPVINSWENRRPLATDIPKNTYYTETETRGGNENFQRQYKKKNRKSQTSTAAAAASA